MLEEKPVILFDGICNFCNRMLHFIIRNDRKDIFRFATLQSGSGRALLKKYNINWQENDSVVLIENGKAYQHSAATLRIYKKFPWYWKWTQLGWIFPRFIRDAVYNLIAKNRYKWFGKKEECMVPTPELRKKFLD
jgi:predicted DCC family thiol-disulfide oxidoreductase YuxK